MQPVHFLHKHFLFSGCCTLILSDSTSSAPTTVHAFCPLSPCSSFAKVTVSTLVWGLGDWQPWRTQRSSTALSALHSPWWLIYTSLQLPIPLLFTKLFAVCVVGGQSWLLRIRAHQYTHHLLSLYNVLNINTICSLRNDKQQCTNCREDMSPIGEFVIPAGNYVACMVNAVYTALCLLFWTHFLHKLTHAFLGLHPSWLWQRLLIMTPLKSHAFKVITNQMWHFGKYCL